MLIYIVPYIYILFTSLNLYFSKIKNVGFWFLIGIITPAFLLAILRGDVGIDTVNYLDYYERLSNGLAENNEHEPGFVFFSEILVSFGLNARLCVAILGIITTFLLCKAFSRSKEEMLLFATLFFSNFYWDFTMNGLRYGLSFAIATFAIHFLYQNNIRKFIFLALIATSIQYSAILLVGVFLISLLDWKKLLFIIFLILVGFIFFSEYFSFFTLYLTGKQDAYESTFSPSVFSGAAPLFVVLLIFFLIKKHSINTSYDKTLYVIVLFEILSFILSKFSYAGLRLQTLFLFALIIYIKNNIDNFKYKKSFAVKITILSMFCFSVFLKNISAQIENNFTPFIPYKFYWEEKK